LENWPFGDVAYQALNDFGKIGYGDHVPFLESLIDTFSRFVP